MHARNGKLKNDIRVGGWACSQDFF